ncbi:IucC family-domain-containing protein [Aspergillus stella-maris]|uniref:IucC family-domain-containing protein n=1 Tax=Aspergillus stella-maris TaxID=1810926 RepID=UPI003CCC9666
MLKNAERKRAELASLTRVAASLINERLVTVDFCKQSIILSYSGTEETICLQLIEPLHFRQSVHASELHGEIKYNNRVVSSGADLMRIFGSWAKLDSGRVGQICREMDNSVENLERAYRGTRSLTIDSPAIDWEQSVVEGHGMHPWHKCRYPLVDDFEETTIHFITLPRSDNITIEGDYDRRIRQIAPAELNQVNESRIIFPVHEYQLKNVRNAFPDAQVLACTVTGRPQSSVRTVSLPGANVDFCVKLPLAVKITSIVRTIRPWAITIGHRLEPVLNVVEEAAQLLSGSLKVIREPAAAASPSEHLGCIIRQSTESLAVQTGEKVIVCAAVAEHIHEVWPEKTQTLEGKLDLLRAFSMHLFRAVLPSVFFHGFALQAHMQNLLIRLDPESGEIRGFFVRDLGSFRVHRETFSASTALSSTDLDSETASWVLTRSDSLEKVHRYILSVVHGDVASMVRALKLGMAGWRVAREELERVIPVGNGSDLARRTWLESTECIARAHSSMQLFGVESECTVTSIPNRFYYCQQGMDSD